MFTADKRACSHGGLLPFIIVPMVLLSRVDDAVQGTAHAVHAPGLGTVRGIASSRYPDVDVFYNIPYAKPPVGRLRWMPPVPYGKLDEHRTFTQPGSICMQPDNMYGLLSSQDLHRPNSGNLSISEDCLTLNIATPRKLVNTRPVMVFFHGGGFLIGGGANYPSDALVATSNHEVIVVTINYRLGVFGFLGSRALAARSFSKTGNYGIDDQRMALRWIQSHIIAFGGDPTAVTIFGESAGGMSGICHLVQPESFQHGVLYHRMILESGTMAPFNPMASAEQTYDMVLSETGCVDVQCLVELDAMRLLAAYPTFLELGLVANPVVDGATQPADPYEMLAAGYFNKGVPIVMGHNREELATFMHLANTWPPTVLTGLAFTEEHFDLLFMNVSIREHFDRDGPVFNASTVARIKELYANTSAFRPDYAHKSYWWWAAVAAGSDMEWGAGAMGHCWMRRVAHMIAAGGSAVFAYVFEHEPQQSFLHNGRLGWNYTRMVRPGNDISTHMMELDYVFGDTLGVAPEEAELAAKMGIAWASFAVFGRPSIGWPRFEKDDEASLHFVSEAAGGVRLERGYRNEQCNFWDQLKDEYNYGYGQPGGYGKIRCFTLGASGC